MTKGMEMDHERERGNYLVFWLLLFFTFVNGALTFWQVCELRAELRQRWEAQLEP